VHLHCGGLDERVYQWALQQIKGALCEHKDMETQVACSRKESITEYSLIRPGSR
jgi:hypothetical protein